MRKIAIIGDIDSIYGFSSLGIDVFPVEDSKGALLKIRELSSDFGVIFIIDSFYNKFENEEKEKLNSQTMPCVVPIVGIKSDASASSYALRNLVKKAVGFDMLEKIV